MHSLQYICGRCIRQNIMASNMHVEQLPRHLRAYIRTLRSEVTAMNSCFDIRNYKMMLLNAALADDMQIIKYIFSYYRKHIYANDVYNIIDILRKLYARSSARCLQNIYYEKCIEPTLFLSYFDLVQMQEIDLSEVPYEYRTYEMSILAIQQSISAFKHMPAELKQPCLCYQIVEKYPHEIQYVPIYAQTSQLWKMGVSKDVTVLRYATDEYKTPKLCKLAVSKKGFMLKYVPHVFKTLKICKLALKNNKCAFKYMPNKYKTLKTSKKVVSEMPNMLAYVPEYLKTMSMCEASVAINPRLLKHVPSCMKTPSLCELAKQSIRY